ncbi:MAG: hypothetical protein KDK54_12435 [Leptospiraceae bacterium]|nr:hypothetical protein [Leptospiraceae bacterium]
MKSLALIIILSFFLPLLNLNAESPYIIFSVLKKSDIDTAMMNELPTPYPREGSFQLGDLPTRKGKYKVYKFLSIHKGEVSYSTKPIDIHELLVLKVDKKGIVQDAYHYTLEWQDSPGIRLYRSTTKNLKLKSGMKLDEFRFKNSDGEPLKIEGYLDNVFIGNKLF